jgi:PTH2 family peptidyl-tRNA hydrolase
MYKQVIVLRKDLKMGPGKLAAQASHASLRAYRLASLRARKVWENEGCKKVILRAESKKILLDIYRKAEGLPRALIKDAGLTQLKRGEITAVGIGPAGEREIDRITGKLKLL